MKNINEYIYEDKWDEANDKASKHMLSVLDSYIDYDTEKEDKSFNSYISFETSIKKSDIKDIAIKFVNDSDVLDWHEVDYNEKDHPCIYVNQFKMPMLNIREKDGKFILTLKGACRKYYEKHIKKNK